ncbi:hypothetical protein [Shimia sagamensis]|uniref:Uncharacterized protein n=1 Tax=Shimia sagamensis TaxID=1566352 RepID=A0ABY1NVA4_9RHOB|nr:hypothetical protein [Shimia sagamensis]SMP18901.1 hypothetical protein SAMN06265373_103351 [Shimia sagamensis]
MNWEKNRIAFWVISFVAFASLLLLYVLSQIVIITKVFTTDMQVALGDAAFTRVELFAVLNQIEEIRDDKSACPDKLGSCWSGGGEIRLVSPHSTDHLKMLRLVTTEGRNLWSSDITSSRHDAFVKRIAGAFLSEGFSIEKVNTD